ncbi:ESPR-type extended signal peptide-containing protein [Veillonella sp. 3310]|uniref:ESPR-type extended signal peptide-containing protein n=1 Tax=Veillonella sp. 3310 TaxID=2490956 RepID=UPI000FD64603|nr:ESPR-type extended signal peptide-containing protein [Veillonella sp. 3310]
MALNRIYKVVWSKTKGCYVVVSELAKRVGRNKAKAIVISSAAMAMAVSPVMVNTVGAAINNAGAGDATSVAFGGSSSAGGQNSVAIGTESQATQNNAVAVGRKSKAIGDSATAIGLDAQASGSLSEAIGVAAKASGEKAVAISAGSNAQGDRSLAIGQNASTRNADTIALGTNATSTASYAVALGRGSQSNADSAIAVGNTAQSTADRAIAMGKESKATVADTIALGTSSEAKKSFDVVIGKSAQSRAEGSGHSIALGYGATAGSDKGVYSADGGGNAGGVAIGVGAFTGLNKTNKAMNSSVAVGAGAGTGYRMVGTDGMPTGNATDADDNDTVLVKAFGGTKSTLNNFKDSGTAKADGFFSFQGVDINEGTALGRNTRAMGDQSVAIGAQSIAGMGSIVIGGNDIQAYDGKKYFKAKNPTSGEAKGVNDFNAETTPGTGKNGQPITITAKYKELVGAELDRSYRASYGQDGSTVIGMQAHSTTPLGVAIGTNSIVRKGAFGATAIGSGASVVANAEAAVAIGMGAEAQGNYAVAAGTAARAKESAVAAGYTANAEVNAVAVGNKSVSKASAVAVGDESEATNSSVAVGQLAKAQKVADIAVGQGAVASGEQGAIAVGLGTQAQGDSSIMIGGSEITKVADQKVNYQKEKKDKQGHTVIKSTEKIETVGGEQVKRTIRSVEMETTPGTIQQAYGELTNGGVLNTATLDYSLPENKNGHGSISMGVHSLSTGDLGTAIGTGARVTKLGGVALGTGAVSELQNGVAIGTGSRADANSIGTRQTDISYDKEGKIVPFDSKKVAYTFYWAGGTNTSEGDVVSFGTPGAERQLKNVAAGRIADDSTDAINGSQLNSVTKRMSSGWAVEAEKDKTSSGVLKLNGTVATAGTEVHSTDGKTTTRENPGTATGHVDKVRLNDEVKIRVGDNLVLHQEDASRPVYEDPDNPGRQTGTRVTSKFTYSLNPELTGLKSAQFKNDAGDTTTINGAGVTVTPVTAGKQPVSLTTAGLNNGGNAISNVAGNLPETKNNDATTGASNATTSQAAPTLGNAANQVNPTNAATVSDVLNAGWNLQGDGAAVDFVKPYDTVNFVKGDGTSVTVESTDGKTSTVKYSVNLGEGLKKDDNNNITVKAADKSLTVGTDGVKVNPGDKSLKTTDAGLTVNTADKSLEVTDAGLKVKAGDKTLTTDANGLKVNTGEIESVTTGANPGTVKVKDGDTGKVATVDSVVNAVNSAAWTATSAATAAGELGATPTDQSVKAGDKVTFEADKNIKITQAGSKFTFATRDDVSFNTVQVGGEQGPKLSKSDAGDLKVSGPNGTDPVKVTNVKDGEISADSKDAINGSQFHKLANNTIQLKGQTGDSAATETKKQELNKENGLAFTIKSSDGSLLEVSAADDTITLKPKTATLTTGADGVPTANTTGGNLVTADQLVNTLTSMGWKATAGRDDKGTVTDATVALIKAGDTVTFKAGNNLAVKQDGKNFIYSLQKELTGLTSAEFKNQAGDKTVINNDGVTITPVTNGKQPVSLTKDGLNNGGNQIANVGGNLDGAKTATTAPTTKHDGVDTTNPTAKNYVNPNNAATVGDVLQAGWNLQGNNTAVDFVKPYDTVNFVDGDGTTVSVSNTDTKTSTVKYSVNLGDGLKKDDKNNITVKAADKSLTVGADGVKVNPGDKSLKTTDAGLTVNTADKSLEVTNDGLKVKAGDNTLTTDEKGLKVNTGTIEPVTTGANPGTVKVKDGDAGKIATVDSVVNAVNSAAWTATSAATSAGELGATPTDQSVKAGDKVTFEADKNIKITQAGSKFTFATRDDVSFNTVQVGGDQGPKLSKSDAGDLKVSGPNGTDPVKVTNVKDGEISADSKDAINGSQFHKLANNTIQLKGQTGDSAATETKKQELNKKDGIAFTVKSSDGSLLEVSAEGDTITLTPKTGTITTTDGVPTEDTTNGKLITADQVVNALKEMGWKAIADKDGSGTVDGAAATLVKAGETVTFKAGDNLAVKQNGKNFIYSLQKELTGLTSAEFKNQAGDKTVINNDGVTITPATNGKQPVSLTKDGLNNGGNPITNVTSNLVNYTDPEVNGVQPAKNSLRNLDDNSVANTNAATVGDLRNMGWIVSSDKTTGANGTTTATAYSEAVKNANEVRFVGEGSAIVSGKTEGNVRTITVKVDNQTGVNKTVTPVNYTKADGTKVYPQEVDNGDGTKTVKFFENPDGTGKEIPSTEVITSVNGPKGTTTPATLSNVKSNLPDTKNSDTANTADAPSNATKSQAAPNTTDKAGNTYVNPNNAATVSDVLNAGWNLQGNGTEVDFVKAYDTVNFIDGEGTTATVASTDGKTSTVKYNVNLGKGLQKDTTGNTISVKPADSSLVVDDAGVKVNTGTINNVTTGDKPGTVEAKNGDENKVATVGNVVNAINNAAWTATSAKTNDGELGKEATNQLVKSGDKVTFEADKNIKITQDGSKFTFTTKNDVSFDTVQVGGDQGPKLSKTDAGDLKVSGPNGTSPVKVTNVTSGLDTYGDNVPGTTDKNRGLVDLSKPENGQPKVSDNTAATVGDLRNMGWIVSADKKTGDLTNAYSDTVKNANEVKFVGEGTAIVSGKTEGDVRTITVKVDDQTSTNNAVTPVVYTDKDGNQVYPTGKKDKDGNQIFNTKPDGKGTDVTGPVKTTINGPKGTDTPTTLSNVEGNLEGAKTNTTAPTTHGAAPNTADAGQPNYVNTHNAATVGDVLQAGWNLQNNGTAKDFVKPYDTVNFVNGGNTTAVVTTNAEGTVSDVTFNVTGLPVTYTTEDGAPVSKVGDKYYKVNDKGQLISDAGKPAVGKNNDGKLVDENNNVIEPIDTTKPLKTALVNPTPAGDKPNTTTATQLGNVTSGLDKYGDQVNNADVPGTTDKNRGLVDLSKPENGQPKVSDNTAATVGDLRNMGWIVSADKKTGDLTNAYSDTVKNANEVKFVGEGTAIVSGKTEGDVRTITVKVDDQTSTNNAVTPVVYTDKDGNQVYPTGKKDPDGNQIFNTKPDGKGTDVTGPVKTTINGPKGTTSPTSLSNVKNNIPAVNDADKKVTNADGTDKPDAGNVANINKAPLTAEEAADLLKPTTKDAKPNPNFVGNNAATVSDVLNAGWNLQNNGTAKDFVKPYDTVNFVDGGNTTAVVTTNAAGTASDVTFNVTGLPVTNTITENGKEVPVVKVGNTFYPAKPDGTPDIQKGQDGNPTNGYVQADNGKVYPRDAVTITKNQDGTTTVTPNTDATPKTVNTNLVNPNVANTTDKPGNNVSTPNQLGNVANGAKTFEPVDGKVLANDGKWYPADKVSDKGTPEAGAKAVENPLAPKNAAGEPLVQAKDGKWYKPSDLQPNGTPTPTAQPQDNVINNKAGLVDFSNSNPNNAATIGDLQNMGWVVSAQGNSYSDQVRNTNEVKFVGEGTASVTGKTDDKGVRTITVKVDDQVSTNNSVTPVVYTDKAGNTVYPIKDDKGNVTYHTTPDGKGENDKVVPNGDVNTSINGPKDDQGNTRPASLSNVKNNIPAVNDADKKVTNPDGTDKPDAGNVANINKAPLTAEEAADLLKPTTKDGKPNPNFVGNNAATVSDVLNAGWNLQNNGTAKDFVKPFDTVNFVNGVNTTAVVTTSEDGTTSNVTYNVTGLPVTYTTADGTPVSKIGDKYYKVNEQGQPLDSNGKPATKINENGVPVGEDGQPISEVNITDTPLTSKLVNPNAKNTDAEPNKKTTDPAQLGNVTSGLDTYGDNVPGTTDKNRGLVDLSKPANGDAPKVSDNTAATVGDLRNMGWIVSSDKTTGTDGVATDTAYSEQVKNANEVKFVGAGTAIVSGNTVDGVRTITVKVDDQTSTNNSVTPVNYTKADGTKVYPKTVTDPKTGKEEVKFFENPDGSGAEVPKGDVVTSINGPEGTTSPTTLKNVKNNIPNVNDGSKTITNPDGTEKTGDVENINKAPLTAEEAAALANPKTKDGQTNPKYIGNNAATVSDVLNAGWNLQNNGAARDFVKPFDTVNFVNGVNTTAVVTTSEDGTTSNVTYNVTGLPVTYTTADGTPVSKIGDEYYTVNDKGQPIDANGKPSTKVNKDGKPVDENGNVIKPIDTTANPLTSSLVNPNVKNTDAEPNKKTTDPTQLGNVTSGLHKYGDTVDGKEVPGSTKANHGLVDLSTPTDGSKPKVSDNTAATVGDLRNMGWIVSSDKTTGETGKAYTDTVKNANEVKFVGEGTAIVSGKTVDGVRTITVKVDDQVSTNNSVTPVNYTKADGTKVYPKMVTNPDTGKEELKFFENPDGSGAEVPKGDVVTSINGPEGTTSPTTLKNVKNNIPNVNDGTEDITKPDGTVVGKTPDNGNINKAPLTAEEAATLANPKTKDGQTNPKYIGNNAATVSDVLNAGWNLQNNGESRDFVKPYDTVNFVNGLGTTAVVTTREGNTASDVTFNVKAANGSVTVDENGVKVTTGEMKPAVDTDNKETGAIATPADPATAKQLKETLAAAEKDLSAAREALKDAEKALAANPKDPALQQAVADKKADVAAKQTPVNEAQKAHDEAGLNKVATVQNVAEAINNAGFNLKTSADGGEKLTGTKDDGELIKPSNTVEMVAGNNLTVKQDANGKITYATKDNVTFTNVDTGTLNVGSPNTYTDGKGNTYTKVGDKYYKPADVVNGAPKPDATPVDVTTTPVTPVSPVTMKAEAAKPATNNASDAQPSSALNVTSKDGKPTQITGVGSTLNTKSVDTTPKGTAPSTTPGTTPNTTPVNLVDLEGTADAPVNKNAAATVGDLQNMGWVVSAKDGNGYKDVVKNANVVDFKGGTGIEITGKTLTDGTREITVGIKEGEVTNKVTITHADGSKTDAIKIGDNYYKVGKDGKPEGYEKGKDGKPAGTPLTVDPKNDKVTNTGAGFVTGNTVANAIQESGWNVGIGSTDKDYSKDAKVYDKVNPNDDVKFANGANTNVSMVTVDAINEDGTKKATTFVKVDVNRDLKIDSVTTGGTAVDKNGNNLVKVGDDYYKESDIDPVTKQPKANAKPVPKADVTPAKDGAMIVKNADGKDVVSATVGKDGNGEFAVKGKDGKDGISMTAKDGQGAIGVNGKDGATTTIKGDTITIKDKEGNTNTSTPTSNELKDTKGNTNTSTADKNELTDKNGNTNTSTPTTNVLKDTNGNTNTSTGAGTTYKDKDDNTAVVGPKEIALTDKSGDNKASFTNKDLIFNAKDPKTGVEKTSHVSGDKIAFTTTDEMEKVFDKDGKPVIDPATGKQKEVIKNPGNSTEYTNEGLKVIPNSTVGRDANGNLTYVDKDNKPVMKDKDGNFVYMGKDGKPGEKYAGAVGALKPNVVDNTRVISFGMDKPVLDSNGNPVKGPDGKPVMTEGISAGMQQIHNVAPGTKDTDAVNVSQLRGTTININNRINRSGAQAAALAGLQTIQYDPLEPTQVSAGLGYYQGASALALGVNHYKNESTLFHVGASFNGYGSEVMANASVTWKFGARADETAVKDTFRQGPISASYTLQDKVSALEAQNQIQKDQLNELRATNAAQKAENEAQREEMALMKAQIAELFKRLNG